MEPEREQKHQEDMLIEEDNSSTVVENGSICQPEMDEGCDEEELLAGDPEEQWQSTACWAEAIDMEELLQGKAIEQTSLGCKEPPQGNTETVDSRRGRPGSRQRTRPRRRQRQLTFGSGDQEKLQEPRQPRWLYQYLRNIMSEIFEMKRSLGPRGNEACDSRRSHHAGGTVVFADSQTWEAMRKKGGACIPGERGTRLVRTNLDVRTEISHGSPLVRNVIVLCGTEDYWRDQNVCRAACALEIFVQTARMRFPCANVLVSSLLHRDHNDQVEWINRRLAKLCREHSRLVLVDNRKLYGSRAFQRDGFTLSAHGLVGLLKNVRVALDWL